jgi:hypothetical protein
MKKFEGELQAKGLKFGIIVRMGFYGMEPMSRT